MNQKINISLLQMTSVDDLGKNLKSILDAVVSAEKNQKNDLICLPENCLYMRVKEGEKVKGISIDSPEIKSLFELSKEHNVSLHLGSLPLLEGQNIFNSSLLITPMETKVSYKKIHLFDIQIAGEKPVRESDVFKAGQKPEIFEQAGWKFGQSICYDLRFAELYSHYAKEQVDVILIPSAFLVTTGQAHWEILLRARAIESQSYVLAAAQAGKHYGINGGERATYGHSLVIDPWGRILHRGGGDHSEVISFSISKDLLNQVRAQIPMSYHRKLI